MKAFIPPLMTVAIALSHLTPWSSIYSQVTQETATPATTFKGTVQAIKPDKLIISGEAGAVPTTYIYTKSTKYVDESGAPVKMEEVKPGLPVTVHYVEDGGRMIAQRVVVRPASPTADATPPPPQTTTDSTADGSTSSAGVVDAVTRDGIAILADGAATPVDYAITNSTKYVDESGVPVRVDVMRSGVPVTVQYADENGRMIAQKVIIKKIAAQTPDPKVKERRKTNPTRSKER